MRRLFVRLLVLAMALTARGAFAQSATLVPPGPVPPDSSAAFEVQVEGDWEGELETRFSFGDGAETDWQSDPRASHRYSEPGHYPVTVFLRAGGQKTSIATVQTVYPELAQRAPSNSARLLVLGERVLVTNPDHGTLGVISKEEGALSAELAVGEGASAIAVDPQGQIWVLATTADRLVRFDSASLKETGRIDLPFGSQAHGLVFGERFGFVALMGRGKVFRFDSQDLNSTRLADAGPMPRDVALSGAGDLVVPRFISPDSGGEIRVLDAETLEIKSVIELAHDESPDTESSGRGLPNLLTSVTIAPDGRHAWVTAKKDNIRRGPLRDGRSVDPENMVRAVVCVVDLEQGAELLDRRLDLDNRSLAFDVVFSPFGDLAYVLALGSNWVGIYDAISGLNLGGLREVGAAPRGLALERNGTLHVHSWLTRSLLSYDLSASLYAYDHGPPPLLSEVETRKDEVLSGSLLRGKRIFHDASDPRMSLEGYISCASCHFEGGSDGRAWDFSDRGEGIRNTKALFALSPAGGAIHWSGNMDELQDFERDIRESMGGEGFMSDEEWEQRSDDPFGISSAGVSEELDDLAAYIHSLRRPMRSPFRNEDGTMSEDARAGEEIFRRSGCHRCHSGENYDEADGGPQDVGTIRASSGHRLGQELTKIETPSLLGVWQSAPYLHDGRASTLREVLVDENQDDLMGVTSDLSEAELLQLERFLLEIDGRPSNEDAEGNLVGSAKGGDGCSFSPRHSLLMAPWGGRIPLLLLALSIVLLLRRTIRAPLNR